jgi:hypothetical protein
MPWSPLVARKEHRPVLLSSKPSLWLPKRSCFPLLLPETPLPLLALRTLP